MQVFIMQRHDQKIHRTIQKAMPHTDGIILRADDDDRSVEFVFLHSGEQIDPLPFAATGGERRAGHRNRREASLPAVCTIFFAALLSPSRLATDACIMPDAKNAAPHKTAMIFFPCSFIYFKNKFLIFH